MKGATRVLVVDDSAVVRQVLSELLNAQPDIEVVGCAADPYEARDKIKQLRPELITLDVEMPRMDGITFLKNLMRLHPLPVVMLSSLTTRGADVTLRALEEGAVDFIAKPDVKGSDAAFQQFQHELVHKVRTAAATGQHLLRRSLQPVRGSAEPVRHELNYNYRLGDVIAIGASTGGTEAVRTVLESLPVNCPPVVVTQHIPPGFSGRFAQRLNQCCELTVCEAQDQQMLEPGHAYIAPGGCHMEVVRHGSYLCCQLNEEDPVNRHRPSVEVLFNSLQMFDARQQVAVMLTGMGNDGAHAMQALKRKGVLTLAQDEATSLVWGMPGQAVKLGGVCRVLPLTEVAGACVQHFAERAGKQE